MNNQYIFVVTGQGTKQKVFQVTEFKTSNGVTSVKKKTDGKWVSLLQDDQIFYADLVKKEKHL